MEGATVTPGPGKVLKYGERPPWKIEVVFQGKVVKSFVAADEERARFIAEQMAAQFVRAHIYLTHLVAYFPPVRDEWAEDKMPAGYRPEAE